MTALVAPFPYFGGKREVTDRVWDRLGEPKQYIEPFCGSAAMLLGARRPASLEVVNDLNGFIANFWRAVKHQPDEVARNADYPVSHIDLGARHRWLMDQRERIGAEMQEADWPGDPKVAGWWLWGQCSWIGSGWCEWLRPTEIGGQRGQGGAGNGKIPHASDAGRGDLLTSAGRAAWEWLHRIAERLERVRVVHGTWDRCLNNHYGGADTAVFLAPPYRAYEAVYGAGGVADAVETWAREHGDLRVALCGHADDYQLPGWRMVRWQRPRLTYSGSETTDKEAIWFSPACHEGRGQTSLFGGAA